MSCHCTSIRAHLVCIGLLVATIGANISLADSSIVAAIADAYINQGAPEENFGSLTILRIASEHDPAHPPLGRKRAFIRFDLSMIPDSAHVTNVELCAYQSDTYIGEGFRVYGLASNWEELDVTWQSQPDATSSIGFIELAPQGYCCLATPELQKLVQDWVNGAENYGMAFFFHDEELGPGGAHTGDTFHSRENINPPILTVTYEHIPLMAQYAHTQPSDENPMIEFTDTSLGNPLSWSWEFSDGETSSEQSPAHMYEVEACHTSEFQVTLTVSRNGDLDEYSEAVPVNHFPSTSSQGNAYVIIGDITPPPNAISPDLQGWQNAANLARYRLQQMGYSVTVLGSANPIVPASSEHLASALQDPDVKAVYLNCHGLRQDQVEQLGQKYKMGDRFVHNSEVSTWRTESGSTLDELTLFACNSWFDPDLRTVWDVAGSIYATPRKTLTTVAEAVERRRRCDSPPEAGAEESMAHQWSDLKSNSRGQMVGFPYLMIMTEDGRTGDEIYGARGGTQAWNTCPTGTIEFWDAFLGVNIDLTFPATDDTIGVWATRYSESPADTVPAESVALSAFIIGTTLLEGEGMLTLEYDQEEADSLAPGLEHLLQVWLYNPIDGDFDTIEEAVHDTSMNTFVFVLPEIQGGLFLLTLPESVASSVFEEETGNPFLPCALESIHPNPVSGKLSFSILLTEGGPVTIQVFDVGGRLLDTVFNGMLGADRYTITWNPEPTHYTPGVYFLQLRTPNHSESRPFALLR